MSRDPLLLGIDVGTTTVKAALVSATGEVVAARSQAYPTLYRDEPGWVEQHPDDWWTTTLAVLAELPDDDLALVAGVGVSSQAPSLVPLDAAGEPVRDALIWMDRRAQADADALAAHYGSGYHARFGNRADPFYVGPKLRWFTRNEPALAERVASYVQIPGYLVLRLTGELSLDDQHASLHTLRAAGATDWDAAALADVGVRPDQLPRVSAATEVVGVVGSAATVLTGIPEGTPVIAGTVDSAAAAIEVGAFGVGSAAEMTGTSSVLVMPTDEPRPDPAFIAMSSPTGRWLTLAAMVASGASLNWFRDVAAAGQDYTAVIARAAESTPGARGALFVPHLMGERSPLWESGARGALVGLTLASSPSDLARAVLEGTALAVRHNLRAAADAGIAPTELRSTGAPSSSDLWCQIKADVTGLPVIRVATPTGAAYGDAALAAVGTGLAPDLESFAPEPARIDREFEPDPANADVYAELFERYLTTIDALRAARAPERTTS